METIHKKIKNALYGLVIIGMMGSISACNNRTSDIASTDDTEIRDDGFENDADAATDLDTDESAWMRERDDFVTAQREKSIKMENSIVAQERNLDAVNEKSSAAMSEGIKSLKTKKSNLDTKLDELSRASGESWQQVRSEVSEASTEMEKSWEAFEKEYNVKD